MDTYEGDFDMNIKTDEGTVRHVIDTEIIIKKQ